MKLSRQLIVAVTLAILPLAILAMTLAAYAAYTSRNAELHMIQQTANIAADKVQTTILSLKTNLSIGAQLVNENPANCAVLANTVGESKISLMKLELFLNGEICGTYSGENFQANQEKFWSFSIDISDTNLEANAIFTSEGITNLLEEYSNSFPLSVALVDSEGRPGPTQDVPDIFLEPFRTLITEDNLRYGTRELAGTVFAVSSVRVEGPYIIAWANDTAFQRSRIALLAIAGLVPLLLILTTVLALHLSTRRLVTSWVKKISQSLQSYKPGSKYEPIGDMRKAPEELALIGRSFDAMAERTDKMTQDLAQSRNAYQTLALELNHRVKTNFQLIASLIGRQRRQNEKNSDKALCTTLNRVNAMAAVFRLAYASKDETGVDISPLLHELATLIIETENVKNKRLEVDASYINIKLSLDTAIPLAFLVMSFLESCVRGSSALTRTISLACHHNTENDKLIIHAGPPGKDEAVLAQNDDRLIKAWLLQIDGSLEQTDKEFILTVPVSS
jgi:hypothetical protein